MSSLIINDRGIDEWFELFFKGKAAGRIHLRVVWEPNRQQMMGGQVKNFNFLTDVVTTRIPSSLATVDESRLPSSVANATATAILATPNVIDVVADATAVSATAVSLAVDATTYAVAVLAVPSAANANATARLRRLV